MICIFHKVVTFTVQLLNFLFLKPLLNRIFVKHFLLKMFGQFLSTQTFPAIEQSFDESIKEERGKDKVFLINKCFYIFFS